MNLEIYRARVVILCFDRLKCPVIEEDPIILVPAWCRLKKKIKNNYINQLVMVEAAGIEPASAGTLPLDLHA